MLFNSLDFAIFLPIVFFVFWIIPSNKNDYRNIVLLISSYIFYGWWDWKFLSLIAFSTIADFIIGKLLLHTFNPKKKKFFLALSIIINLGILGFFKYYNFFLENFIQTIKFFGKDFSSQSLNIILPVGISFYTFQTMSYTIDIYRNKMKPTNNLLEFASFVSFFPQLVAGPIERASNLLAQFKREKKFRYQEGVLGLRQILWGFFKKLVIADNCAEYVNLIFNNYEIHTGPTLILGAVLFSFQIYGDFSGYSDIAIGAARLFGFKLMKNFAFPYFSRDIAEFWRRWHISLSTWFRDYLYIPLGGSIGGLAMKLRNTFMIFIVSGFWHGANWTFIIWGFLNALFFLPLLLQKKNRQNIDIVAQNKKLPSLNDLLKILITFSLTTLAWVFFRSDSVLMALNYLHDIFSNSWFAKPKIPVFFISTLILIFLFIVIEWVGRRQDFAIEKLFVDNRVKRWGFYSFICFLLAMYSQTYEMDFIYFQF